MRVRFIEEMKAHKIEKESISQHGEELLLTATLHFKSKQLTALERLEKSKNVEMKFEIERLTRTLLRQKEKELR